MENKTNQSAVSTKANETAKGLLLSPKDAEEYRAYKRQKRVGEIVSAFARSATPIGAKDDVQRICERAVRLRQASVKVAPLRLMRTRAYLAKSAVNMDCIIGGDGETFVKVKAYEAKTARKLGAKELTLVLTPSLVATCRYGEIKREIRRIKRSVKKACLKVWVDKSHPYATIARTARICCDLGVQYFCVPYFAGCERLRFDLTGGCQLEICGVETLADFKQMRGAGVGRIVTSRPWELYNEWMKEAEKIGLEAKKEETPAAVAPVKEEKTDAVVPVKQETAKLSVTEEPKKPQEEKIPVPPLTLPTSKDPDNDYRCRLEGTELKFL